MVYTAREDEEYVVLEEDFSKVTTLATPENPDEFESSSLVILDEYTLLPNWLFSGGLRLANGMAWRVWLAGDSSNARTGAE